MSNFEDIFGDTTYSDEKPSEKPFAPWHKPRKQFVRSKQWTDQLISARP